MTKNVSDPLVNDPDRGKGSLEPDERTQEGNNSMQDQLGHRATALSTRSRANSKRVSPRKKLDSGAADSLARPQRAPTRP
jgi:hypothetical protein